MSWNNKEEIFDYISLTSS